MAFASGNVDRKFGLAPRFHHNGGVIRARKYYIASAFGTSIFRGDLVKLTNTSRQIEDADAGDRAVGVFDGCMYTAADGSFVFSPYYPASVAIQSGTVIEALVYDDPDIVFSIQCDEDLEAADIGASANLIAGTGDTKTGLSAMQLDSSDIGVNQDRNFMIIGLSEGPDNSFGTNAKADVLIQLHQYRSAVTAV